MHTSKKISVEVQSYANPYLWSCKPVKVSIRRIDLSLNNGDHNFSTLEIVKVFCRFGEIDLELRDVPRTGHTRLFQSCNRKGSRQVLERVRDGESFVGIAIAEELAGSNVKGNASSVAARMPLTN